MMNEKTYEAIQKRVDDHHKRISSINFYQPVRSIGEANSIIPKVEEVIGNYSKSLIPYLNGSDSYTDAAQNLVMEMDKISRRLGRGELAREAESLSMRFIWNGPLTIAVNDDDLKIKKGQDGLYSSLLYMDAIRHLSRSMLGEIVKDVPGMERNCFNHLIELYEMGVNPTAFRYIDGDSGKKRFIVDIPVKIDGEKVWGCYAQGDGEILWTHNWNRYCTNSKWDLTPDIDHDFSLRPIKTNEKKIRTIPFM